MVPPSGEAALCRIRSPTPNPVSPFQAAFYRVVRKSTNAGSSEQRVYRWALFITVLEKTCRALSLNIFINKMG